MSVKFLLKFFERHPKFAVWCYNRSYFPQLGMMRHDAIRKWNPIVEEAIRRLPDELSNQRQFRITRALHLGAKHKVLPRDQWMKIEDDVPYLDPYIAQVKKEVEARKKFEAEILAFEIPKKPKVDIHRKQ